MDTNTLANVMGNVIDVPYSEYTQPFNEAMTRADVNTPLRAAHFIAQMGHESGGLKYLEEIHDGSNYEWRSDLGNTKAGFGKLYKGRGICQLTGHFNYGRFSQWCHSEGLVSSPTYFQDNPQLVATPQWAFLVAAWYWKIERPLLNSQADADNLELVTRSINGGTRGYEDRKRRLKHAKKLGTAILPTSQGNTMANYWTEDWSSRFWEHGSASKSAIILHTTENTATTPATNVAQYQINSKTGSYHAIVDNAGRRIRCNTDDQITWSCGNRGNNVGLNVSFVAQAAWSRETWLKHEKLLRGGAQVVAYWCEKHNIPKASISPAELKAGKRGISDHNGARIAWGGTTHTDVGSGFPWDVFVRYVNEAKASSSPAPTPAPTPTVPKEDSNLMNRLIQFVTDQLAGPERNKDGTPKWTGWPQLGMKTLVDAIAEIRNDVKEILKAVKENK